MTAKLPTIAALRRVKHTKKATPDSVEFARPGGRNGQPAGKALASPVLGVQVVRVGIGAARADMPRMVRESALHGTAYLIANSRNADDPGALLISPATLERALDAAKRPVRTLGDIVRSLPMAGSETPRIRARALPADTLPRVRLPD